MKDFFIEFSLKFGSSVENLKLLCY